MKAQRTSHWLGICNVAISATLVYRSCALCRRDTDDSQKKNIDVSPNRAFTCDGTSSFGVSLKSLVPVRYHERASISFCLGNYPVYFDDRQCFLPHIAQSLLHQQQQQARQDRCSSSSRRASTPLIEPPVPAISATMPTFSMSMIDDTYSNSQSYAAPRAYSFSP
jgi:hypothetical protein